MTKQEREKEMGIVVEKKKHFYPQNQKMQVKNLNINLRFRTYSDLCTQLNLIKHHAKNGVDKFKRSSGETKTEYEMNYLNEFSFEIEEIDGKQIMVIPSKMNKQIVYRTHK